MKTDFRRLLAGGLMLLAGGTAALGYEYLRNSSTGLPVKWSTSTIGLRILLDNTAVKIDGSTLATSAQDAAQRWNTLLGSTQFQGTITTGTTTNGASGGGIRNELAMGADVYGTAFDTNTIAVTTAWRAGNERTEGDIIFNSARTWDSYAGNRRSGILDLHRVALHELGHLIGLGHPDEATPVQTVSAVMNSRISDLDTLAMDDISGGQNLYGPPGPPLNNNFASATAITNLTTTGTVTLTGFNTLATKETGEPSHAFNGNTPTTPNSGGRSVWWKWTAPASGSITVDTGKADAAGKTDTTFPANKSSYFDTLLGVYTGSSVSALTSIASNDDITPGVVQVSKVTFNATTATTYYFAVDGFDGDTGGIVLNLDFTAAAATPPTITTQPASGTVTAGGNALFSVTATAGTSTITYQWMFNGAAISGATSASLSLSGVTAASAGSYTVVVSTTGGSVTSSVATLTVNPVVVTPPTPTPPASSGGGGGGGAPSVWFLLALGSTGLVRLLRRR